MTRLICSRIFELGDDALGRAVVKALRAVAALQDKRLAGAALSRSARAARRSPKTSPAAAAGSDRHRPFQAPFLSGYVGCCAAGSACQLAGCQSARDGVRSRFFPRMIRSPDVHRRALCHGHHWGLTKVAAVMTCGAESVAPIGLFHSGVKPVSAPAYDTARTSGKRPLTAWHNAQPCPPRQTLWRLRMKNVLDALGLTPKTPGPGAARAR